MPKRRRKSSKQAQKKQAYAKPQGARASSGGELGVQAFRRGDYTEAIRQWDQLDEGQNPRGRPALAEAHFRRALAARQQPDSVVEDIRRATELCSDEARYWYHLGLALHRADRVNEARVAYAWAAECGWRRQGFGFTRGLADIECQPHRPLDDLLRYLTSEERAVLAPVAALLRGDPEGALEAAAEDPQDPSNTPNYTDASASFWQGLAHLSCGQAEQALNRLTLPKGQRLRSGAEPVRMFYHGLAAAATGNTQMALDVWTEGAKASSRGGLPTRLEEGVAHLHAQRLTELYASEQWEELLKETKATLDRTPDDGSALRMHMIASNRLAVAAVKQGDWTAALSHWHTMRVVLETHPDLGPLPPVLRNLAIACEMLEMWDGAAGLWAVLLATLPRRGSKRAASEQTNGAPVEKQREWLRRRILDNYRRADRPDEAISHYKKAVQADPDDLDLRLELASTLLANDQIIAARNELRRIIERDETYVDAYVMLAEVHQARFEEAEAEQMLRRALKVDPEHAAIREALGQILLLHGINELNAGQYKRARATYEEALTYDAANSQTLVFLAETELKLGNRKAAHTRLEAALATGTLEAHVQVFTFWIKQEEEQEARRTVDRAETAGIATPAFYVAVGAACLLQSASAPSLPSFFGMLRKKEKVETPWTSLGHEYIRKGLASAQDRASLLDHLVDRVGMAHPELVVDYARQLVEETPDDPHALMRLSMLLSLTDDVNGARRALKDAERLARKRQDQDLLDRIREVRQIINSPLRSMMRTLVGELDDDFWKDFE